MANNANIRAINESTNTANSELCQALVATQHQVAELARAVNKAHQRPAWAASPAGGSKYYASTAHSNNWGIPNVAPLPIFPLPQPPQDIFQLHQGAMGGRHGRGHGRGRGGHGRGGRGGCGRCGGVGFQPIPPANVPQAGGQPTGGGGGAIPPPITPPGGGGGGGG